MQLNNKQKFNPNYKVGDKTLFEIAAGFDENLAKNILAQYENVDITKVSKSRKFKDLVTYYETEGKYNVKLNNIRDRILEQKEPEKTLEDLLNFVKSSAYKTNIKTDLQETPMHIAAMSPCETAKEIIGYCIDKGCDINDEDIAGQTPLMIALREFERLPQDKKQDTASNINYILMKNPNVDKVDKKKQSAFHYVCGTTSAILLTMILRKEPNIFLKDIFGKRGGAYIKNGKMKEVLENYIKG